MMSLDGDRNVTKEDETKKGRDEGNAALPRETRVNDALKQS